MLKTLREKLISGLLSCACLFAGAGFGVAVEGANAETSGVKNDNPSVAQNATAPFAQGSLGDSYSQTLVVSQGNSLARATALRMTESGEGMSGEAYSLEIVSKNVSYSESMYLMYAVSWSGFTRQVDQVKMLFWDEPQAEYTYKNATFVQDEYSITYLKNEECLVFYSEGISAKEMVDISYCAAYAVVNGVEVYSAVERYSIADYIYDMRQKANITDKQKNMFTDMLNYGASAQILLDYRVDVLANKNRYEITVMNGVLPDGFSVGRYQEGERIVLTAEENFGGAIFSHWEDESGAVVGGTLSSKITISGNKTYKAVYRDDLTYELSAKGDYYTVTGYRGKGGALVIPSEFMGIPVRYVAEKAFQDNAKITSVTIGEGVLTLGAYAFSGCSSLTSISLPSTVKSVGDYALYACANLANISVAEGNAVYESIDGHLYFKGADYMLQYAIGSTATEFVVPESVTSIAGSAFRGAVNLTKVVIGDQVTVIGSNAFKGCTNLTIYCEASEQPSGWNSGWNGGSPVVWGYGVTPASAFQYTNNGKMVTITKYKGGYLEVVIPSAIDGVAVTTIADWSFATSSDLTSVVIPESVTSIGELAFVDCGALTSITVNENNPSFQSIEGNLYTKDGTLIQYVNGKMETEFSIPDSITGIGGYAFYNCDNLATVVIPAGVTTIGGYAFYGCGKLTIYCEAESCPSGWNSAWNASSCPVVWGYQLATPASAFEYTSDGESVTITKYVGEYIDVVIPSTIDGLPVTKIGDSAFANLWDSLTSVVIPDSVTSIGDFAFASCVSLTSVIIPCSVKSIGIWAFCNCYALTTVTMLDGVTSIGESVFFDCRNLTTVVLPKSLMIISDQAFANCNSLTSIEIPNSVTSIGVRVFSGCTALTSITVLNDNENYKDIDGNLYTKDERLIVSYAIGKTEKTFTVPNTVTSIGVGSFPACINLTKVNMPVGLTSIGSGAFASCSSLTSVEIPDSVTSIGEGAFYNCSNLTIYCEAESQPDGWDVDWNLIDYNNNERAPVVWGLTPASAFEWTSDGESVTITKYVGEYTDVVIPATIDGFPVTKIGEGVFSNRSNLNSAVIPDSVTSIGYWAFANCYDLMSVVIGNGVINIEENAFPNCRKLKSVILGNNVTSIGRYAFWMCESLIYIIIPESVTSIGYDAFYGCSNLTIYCVAESQPEGWDSAWNDNCSVVWGYIEGTEINIGGTSFDDAILADIGSYDVIIDETGEYVYFVFTPAQSGWYEIYSLGEYDTYGYLYDVNANQLASDDGAGNGNNFSISYYMNSGETYYIGVRMWDSSATGAFTLVIS